MTFISDADKAACKGLIFRGYSSVFSRSSGQYEHRQGFKLLKRSSCPGCPNCGGLLDYADEALCEDGILLKDPIDAYSTYRLTCDCEGEFVFTKIKKG